MCWESGQDPRGLGNQLSSGFRSSQNSKNRGTTDIFYLVCDGLSGLPEAVNTVFERTIVQNCVIHMIRNSMRCIQKSQHSKSRWTGLPSTGS